MRCAPCRGRAPPRARRRSRRPVVAGAAAGMAAGAALLAVFLATTGSEEPIVVRPNSVAILDAESGKVVDQIGVGPRPADVAAAAGSVWVSNLADNTVTQIEARSRQIAGTITPGITVNGLAASPSGVWVADSVRASATRYRPGLRQRRQRRSDSVPEAVPEDFRPVAATAKAVWIAGNDSGVVRLDPRTRRVLHRTPVGSDPTSVAVGAGGVWVSDEQDGTVTRIDPRTNRRGQDDHGRRERSRHRRRCRQRVGGGAVRGPSHADRPCLQRGRRHCASERGAGGRCVRRRRAVGDDQARWNRRADRARQPRAACDAHGRGRQQPSGHRSGRGQRVGRRPGQSGSGGIDARRSRRRDRPPAPAPVHDRPCIDIRNRSRDVRDVRPAPQLSRPAVPARSSASP